MKLKDSEKMALLILVGVAAVVLVFMYVAKPNYEEVQTINTEITQLQARLAELNQKQANREQYIADTEKYNSDFEDLLDAFPADMNQEITIMFLDGIKTDNDFALQALEMGQKEQFYTLGQGGGDASLATTGTDTAASTEAASTEAGATTAATTEATTTTEAATGDALTEDTIAGDDAAYKCFRAAFPIDFYGSYDSLKDVMNYVAGYQDRMTINTLEVKFDGENNVYTGALDLYCYSIESSERPERQIDLNEVEIGVDNIFDTDVQVGGSDSDNSLNKYDENDGAALENNYDFYAMLNSATSDVSAKIVGQNGTGKEASVISNADNSVSTLTFDFYEKDGKNYCKYTLDDSTSYEAEVTSAEDIKVLLQSSARKNDDDEVGIRVTIRNTTSLPVYVKVSGDDSVSPRVDIASKSGSVKVYK
jgi:Tfp pilus assembly protein PilO